MISDLLMLAALAAAAEPPVEMPDTTDTEQLGEIVVSARQKNIHYSDGVENAFRINQGELFRAACCNLGESFVTNPSVDVSYDDAATGARQIKLLGLSGAYIQMLTENLPNYRGIATPYSLGYVPGTWMQSIQVSKGCASVKNGYESITGQTNIEFLKPQGDEQLIFNAYGDSKLGFEANAGGNIHITDKLSTLVLAHWEDDLKSFDHNHDGFEDTPRVRQVHAMNRWGYFSDKDIFQAGFSYLNEKRTSGQLEHSHGSETTHDAPLYTIGIVANRYNLFAKNAFILNKDNNANIAVMGNASLHSQDAHYGLRRYDADQRSGYLSAMYESDFGQHNKFSAGISINHDRLTQDVRMDHDASLPLSRISEEETSAGVYAQYTYLLADRLTAMAGLRADHSNRHGWFVTPRAHIKYEPLQGLSLRASAGKGYRHVFALAENSHLLAAGRPLVISSDLPQEEAWNYGVSIMWKTEVFTRPLTLTAEYYYTDFSRRVIVDYDTDTSQIAVCGVDGKSYSHNFQVEATFSPMRGLTMTGAWRYNDVKATYGGVLRTQPLTNRYKGLLTVGYVTPLELWHFDITAQFNGGGRMPDPMRDDAGNPLWDTHFHSFAQLSAQITRDFRGFSVYIGGENLTGFRQKQTIINAADPWSSTFDPTMVWGPVHGPMIYAGVRINLSK